jgi:GT2 family glycosyltransferase
MIKTLARSEPTVCAVISSFNSGHFLLESVRSLLNQTHKPDRIIVIDDASTDGSFNLLADLAGSGLIEIRTNTSNLGRAISINSVFRSVACDYFILQDADDIAFPSRIEHQLAFMEADRRLGCSSSFIEYIGSSGKKIGKGILDLVSNQRLEEYLAGDDPFGLFCPAIILRAEAVKHKGLQFRGQFWPADDIDLWNRIAEAGWLVRAQPETLVQYRIHGSSAVTSSFVGTRMQYEWLRACLRARRGNKPEPSREEFLALWDSAPVLERGNRFRKIQAKGLYRAAGFAFAERRLFKAAVHIFASFVMSPIYTVRRLLQQHEARLALLSFSKTDGPAR